MQTDVTVEQSSPIPTKPIKLPLNEIIKTAWSKVYGAKKVLFLAFLINIIAEICLKLVDFGSDRLLSDPLPSIALSYPITTTISTLIVYVITYIIYLLLVSGAIYLGIRRAADLPIKLAMMFKVFRQAKTIIALMLCITLIMAVAALPIFIPVAILAKTEAEDLSALAMFLTAVSYILGFALVMFISLRLSMALPLVLDRQLSAIKAIKQSFHGTRKNFWRLAVLSLLGFLGIFVSIITIGIAGIWLAPFAYILYATMYQKLFGIAQQV